MWQMHDFLNAPHEREKVLNSNVQDARRVQKSMEIIRTEDDLSFFVNVLVP